MRWYSFASSQLVTRHAVNFKHMLRIGLEFDSKFRPLGYLTRLEKSWDLREPDTKRHNDRLNQGTKTKSHPKLKWNTGLDFKSTITILKSHMTHKISYAFSNSIRYYLFPRQSSDTNTTYERRSIGNNMRGKSITNSKTLNQPNNKIHNHFSDQQRTQ